MKTYKIPCTWEMYGVVEVEADSLDKAIRKVLDSDMGLPSDSHYVDDSFQVEDRDTIKEMNSPTDVDEYILPSHYASALINSDWSGLTDEDIEELHKWLHETDPGGCVGIDEDDGTWFQHGHDMNRNQGADVCRYYFKKQ